MSKPSLAVLRSIILIAVITTAIGTLIYLNRTPYGPTPEKAIAAYLDSVTNSYEISQEEKYPEYGGDFEKYAVTAICKYNWRGSNQGRTDGVNTYFFDLRKTEKGWHVSAANSGP